MFQISTRLRYGLRALIYMAEKEGEKAVNLHEISVNEHISRKYLENIFKLLKKGKIIKSERGREGGYILARKPEQITLYEIAFAVEGGISLIDCLSDNGICGRYADCGIRSFWGDYQDYIRQYLENVTLEQIIGKYLKGNVNIPCVAKKGKKKDL